MHLLIRAAVGTHADFSRSLGPDNPQTLGCAGNLAVVLHDQGKIEEALAVYETNLKALKAKLGPQDINTLRAALNVVVELVRALTPCLFPSFFHLVCLMTFVSRSPL